MYVNYVFCRLFYYKKKHNKYTAFIVIRLFPIIFVLQNEQQRHAEYVQKPFTAYNFIRL